MKLRRRRCEFAVADPTALACSDEAAVSCAERDIQAGEEIVISYGNLSDAQLLQTYGFVEEHEGFTNPWNFMSVPSSLVVQVTPSCNAPGISEAMRKDNSFFPSISSMRICGRE